MDIKVTKLGRRFNREWIFRDMDLRFESGRSYAVLGPNGSGKSTFIQVISGSLTPSEGRIVYSRGGNETAVEDVYPFLSFAAPYLELIEEFSLSESIDFHFRFNRYMAGMDSRKLVTLLGFERVAGREVRYFSSGMKQRLKLALAICSDTPLLLLDEPAANLDEQGIDWYHALIDRFGSGRTIFICSNQVHEYDFCAERIRITDFK